MKKTRILYVIASSKIGGAENFIYTLLKHIDSARFEKYIVCPQGGHYSERFKALTNKALFINPKQSFMIPGNILRTSRFIKDNNIDIIHTMLYTSDFCGIAASLLSGSPHGEAVGRKRKLSTLLLLDKLDNNLKLALRNISFLDVNSARDTHAYEILAHRKVIITKNALIELGNRLK